MGRGADCYSEVKAVPFISEYTMLQEILSLQASYYLYVPRGYTDGTILSHGGFGGPVS